ncbi:MAG: hypothetical protein ACJAYF_002563 [Arenicella sp.]|jgi:hypothetical protein
MNIFKKLCLSLLLIPNLAFAQIENIEYKWEEKRNKNGIVIQTSNVAGSSFRAVRGEMTVTGSIASLVALVEDMKSCPKWADLCREARVEKRVSATESYAYVYNDIPFPVSDRDVYTHVVWTQDPVTKRLTMTSTATSGGTPKSKAVRIENAVSQWHFSTNQDGTITVESFAHIDPNGPTPAWLTNMMLVDSPYKSMTKMRNIIESGGYADANVPFLEKF